MNIIPIYSSESLYYCYSVENNKLYVGRQRKFNPNFFYFCGIYLIINIAEKMDAWIANNPYLYYVITFFVWVSVIGFAFVLHNQLYKKTLDEVKLLDVDDNMIKNICLDGKRQFVVQMIIVISLFTSGIVFWILEWYFMKVVFAILKMLCTFCIILLILWIRPIARIKLLKRYNESA